MTEIWHKPKEYFLAWSDRCRGARIGTCDGFTFPEALIFYMGLPVNG
jgi:hypothetical protein